MAGWKINQSGIDELFSAQGDVGRYHDRVVRRVVAEIQRRTPVRTGLLRASWRVRRFAQQGDVLRSVVYTEIKYAPYLINGTANGGTGYIYPRRARVLRFRGQNGEWIYRRRVRGIKPNDFVQEGVMAAVAGTGHRVRFSTRGG